MNVVAEANKIANSLTEARQQVERAARLERRLATYAEYEAAQGYKRTASVEVEAGTVEILVSWGGNSKRGHARATYKLNGKRLAAAEAAKLA